MSTPRIETTFTTEGLVEDYLKCLREALSSEAKISEAIKDREILVGKPDLAALRKKLDEKGNPITIRGAVLDTDKDNKPIYSSRTIPLEYLSKERAENERKKFFDETAQKNLSELELIAFTSAYFSAGANLGYVYIIPDPTIANQYKITLNQIREITARELSSVAGFKDLTTLKLKDGFNAKLNSLAKLIPLEITCQKHLENLKAKHPKSEDIGKISNLLAILTNKDVPPEDRIKTFLHGVSHERKGLGHAFLGRAAQKFSSGGDSGIYGLWQKVKQDYKDTFLTRTPEREVARANPSKKQGPSR